MFYSEHVLVSGKLLELFYSEDEVG